MDFYPINLNLNKKNILIVGAGTVALRKFKRLAAAGALITVVSPEINNSFLKYLNKKTEEYKFIKRKFRKDDLNDIFMVFAASNDHELNKKITSLAKKKNILINTADNAEDSDFILPSVVEQGKLLLTISTSSNLPALSKKIRKKLENIFSIEYQLLLELMEKKRKYIIENIENEKLRKEIFHKIASEDFLNKIRKIIAENYNNIEQKECLDNLAYQKSIKESEKSLLKIINEHKDKFNNYN